MSSASCDSERMGDAQTPSSGAICERPVGRSTERGRARAWVRRRAVAARNERLYF